MCLSSFSSPLWHFLLSFLFFTLILFLSPPFFLSSSSPVSFFCKPRCFYQAAQENLKVICHSPSEKAHLSPVYADMGEFYM